MIRLFANANYDFIKWRRWAYGITAAVIIPGFSLFLIRGLNYSIEFTGGTLIQVQTPEPVGPERIAARSTPPASGTRRSNSSVRPTSTWSGRGSGGRTPSSRARPRPPRRP